MLLTEVGKARFRVSDPCIETLSTNAKRNQQQGCGEDVYDEVSDQHQVDDQREEDL
jgi:hypothetical protein